MTTPTTNPTVESPQPPQDWMANLSAWMRPTVSPEHGVYVVLLVSFVTGAAAAQHWTWATTFASICAICGFQAEHPLAIQIRQRKTWKPRLLLWGIVYGGISSAIAFYLYWRTGDLFSPLLWIYLGAIAALLFDGFSIWHREQKSIINEIVTFAAVSLSAPFSYVVSTNHISTVAIGLWLLNALFFSSSIFTVKLRKLKKDESLTPAIQRIVVYHLLATGIIIGLYAFDILPQFTALSFGVVLIKVGLILWQQQWYCTTRIQSVAMLETLSALLFFGLSAISVLPNHLG
ncbi:YwiC-like family protein [Altericista sp. CCNU0014]|uniref:YwiC-like family protein n=1 Tax=Altericista sp. CCNU0014 TaxID=3082949 RepID=UPI00384E5AA4